MNENNEKRADNLKIDAKQKINKIDGEIENVQKYKKALSELKDSFININKSFDICYYLLQQSIQGKNINLELNEKSNENAKATSQITEDIDRDISVLNKKIEELLDEKEKIQKEKRDE